MLWAEVTRVWLAFRRLLKARADQRRTPVRLFRYEVAWESSCTPRPPSNANSGGLADLDLLWGW
jgi:hypothetical protein